MSAGTPGCLHQVRSAPRSDSFIEVRLYEHGVYEGLIEHER
ncbi:predicted protein [Streptomyces filamentosus NRRL 15998]|uniref:Predicted protein n=1 Tax=Streptomyces filamentosus NRRL 15998 TaxID=457431 RepID=D6AGY6_STRFL|nr:predicted protein [Streptomyces filamentosus NRRL 15998]